MFEEICTSLMLVGNVCTLKVVSDHSLIKQCWIGYEEAPVDSRSCRQHAVHLDTHFAGEHG